MADPDSDDLALFLAGVDVWNKAKPKQPNLVGATSFRANLSGANLLSSNPRRTYWIDKGGHHAS